MPQNKKIVKRKHFFLTLLFLFFSLLLMGGFVNQQKQFADIRSLARGDAECDPLVPKSCPKDYACKSSRGSYECVAKSPSKSDNGSEQDNDQSTGGSSRGGAGRKIWGPCASQADCPSGSTCTRDPADNTKSCVPSLGGGSAGNTFPQCVKNPEYVKEGTWQAGACDPCTGMLKETRTVTDCSGKNITESRSQSCESNQGECNRKAIDSTITSEGACTEVEGCWITPANKCIQKGAKFDCSSVGCYTCSPDEDQIGYIQPPGKPAAAPPKDRPSCEYDGGCWTGRLCIPKNESKDGYCCAPAGKYGNERRYTALVPGLCGATPESLETNQGSPTQTNCSFGGNWRCFFRGRRVGESWECKRVDGKDICL